MRLTLAICNNFFHEADHGLFCIIYALKILKLNGRFADY